MLELIAAVAAAIAMGAGGFAVGRYWRRPVEMVAVSGEARDTLSTEMPPPCKSRGHDAHIKGTRVVDGVKHAEMYCSRPTCGREWLRPL